MKQAYQIVYYFGVILFFIYLIVFGLIFIISFLNLNLDLKLNDIFIESFFRTFITGASPLLYFYSITSLPFIIYRWWNTKQFPIVKKQILLTIVVIFTVWFVSSTLQMLLVGSDIGPYLK